MAGVTQVAQEPRQELGQTTEAESATLVAEEGDTGANETEAAEDGDDKEDANSRDFECSTEPS